MVVAVECIRVRYRSCWILGFPLESCVSAYSVFESGGGGAGSGGESESEEVMVQNMMEYILTQRS